MNKLDRLIEWAKRNGAEISSDISFLQISLANYGATTDAVGPSVINVPPEILIRLSTAANSFGIDMETAKKTKNINGFVKLFLARERQSPDSFFHPYLHSLPSSSQINSPYVWLKEDKTLLQGTNLGSSLRENIQLLVAEWMLVIEALPAGTKLPEQHAQNMKFFYESKFYDDAQLHDYLVGDDTGGETYSGNWAGFPAYMWASMVLKSRAFPSALVPSQEIDKCQDDVVMLVPVADLLNHDPRADVTWQGSKNGFEVTCRANPGPLCNNYGRKGNEELILAYGFCLEDNSADTVALKIKIPSEILPELLQTVQLPKLSDYTTSVVPGTKEAESDGDGLLFFVSRDHVPENLVQVFLYLVKNAWDGSNSLRLRLSGLNYLRLAVESKAGMIRTDAGEVSASANAENLRIYLSGQKKILQSAVSWIKHQEAELLSKHKSDILTLKAVYKKDEKFANSLLVTMGITSYADIVAQEQTDQVWLLYIIRCYNLKEYQETLFPEWVCLCFSRIDAETDLDPADIVRFQGIYEGLVLPMNKAVPEIYNRGKWTVRELIVSSKVMDTIGFVRGKHQECILVRPETDF